MVESNVFITLVRKLVKRHIIIYLEEYTNTRERGDGNSKSKVDFYNKQRKEAGMNYGEH